MEMLTQPEFFKPPVSKPQEAPRKTPRASKARAPKEEAKPLPVASKPPPTPPEGYRYARYFWIGRDFYLIPKSYDEISRLVFLVLGGREAMDWNVSFKGKKFRCDHLEILEKFLLHYILARKMGECDPVLDDGTGMNIELRVSVEELLASGQG
jgi:hypothetical protein